MSLEIESSDVIRLIQQFYKENNLLQSLEALQNETGVTLNTIDNIENFICDIREGHWDNVLRSLQGLKLPNQVLVDLYEQMVVELIEMREMGAARSLLRQTDPMDLLKQTLPDRYLKLENLLSKTYFDPKEIYGDAMNKLKRREAISLSLRKDVNIAPPSRLLTLLGQSLKWQQLQGILPPGTSFDLFRGKVKTQEHAEESYPKQLALSVKFAPSTYAQVVYFSPDGQYLVSGSSDGFIEVWNYMTGKIRKDLKYQDQDNFMLMEDPVTALDFSSDSEFLASGSSAGKLKVWRISSGSCIQRLDTAHTQSISCILFSKDNGQLFTGSVDNLIRLHSLKSGALNKEFVGHESFINSIAYNHDYRRIISSSSDGTIKIWSIKSTECLNTFSVNLGSVGYKLVINTALLMPGKEENYLISNRSTNIFIMNKHGQIIKSFNNGRQEEEGAEFILCLLSPKGNWIYAVTNNKFLYCLSLKTGKFEHYFKLHDEEVFGLVHHPYQNIISSCGSDGFLKIWKE